MTQNKRFKKTLNNTYTTKANQQQFPQQQETPLFEAFLRVYWLLMKGQEKNLWY